LCTTILTAELQPLDLILEGTKQGVVDMGHLDIPNVLSLLSLMVESEGSNVQATWTAHFQLLLVPNPLL
jgi:hypothetical protein